MNFISDRQRKAVFAQLNRFSDAPKIVKLETPMGTMLAKEDFVKEMETATVQRIPKKKNIVDIIKEEGGTVQTFDPTQMSKKPERESALQLAKNTYDRLWDNPNMSYDEAEKATHGFLKDLLKEKDTAVQNWASKELEKRRLDKKTEREEALFNDPSKGTDPDWDAPDGTDFGYDSDYSVDPKKVVVVNTDLGPMLAKEEFMEAVQRPSVPIEKKTYDIGTYGKSMPEQMQEFIDKKKRGVSLGDYVVEDDV